MATWRAEVFVNSQVGRITTEVEAATFSGAKQQIYAKHGDVQQITNLRQVSSGGGGSSMDSDSSAGLLILGAIGVFLYLIVHYWYIAIPIGIVLLILIGMGMDD
jgi:hypothetical protein